MVVIVFLLAAALSQAAVTQVKGDGYALKAGCEEGDDTRATLPGGIAVEVRFALSGSAALCYAVTATVDGKSVHGYLPGSAIAGIEEFERERAGARAITSSTTVSRPAPPTPLPNLQTRSADQTVLAAVRLLESQQPAQALTLLEDVLRKHPQNPDVLSLAGMAAFRSDDIRRARGYWQDALAIRPNPEIERMLKKVEKEAAADRSGQQLHGARFVLRYDDAVVEPVVARQMVALLEQEYSRISYELGCRTEERIATIVQSVEAYRRGSDAAEWSAGFFDGSRIRVPVGPGGLTPETRQTFAHEIVHACLASTGRWPAWLHEGLADRLSGDQPKPADVAQLRAMARAGHLPKLNNLGQSWSRMSAQHARVAYALASLAVDAYYTHYREFGIRNLLRNPDKLTEIADDLDRRIKP